MEIIVKFNKSPYLIGSGAAFLFALIYFVLTVGFDEGFAGLPMLIPFFVLMVYLICYFAELLLNFFQNKKLVFKLFLLLLISALNSTLFSLLFYRNLNMLLLIWPLLTIGSMVYYFFGRFSKNKKFALFLSTSPIYIFVLSFLFYF
jgi:hypothetical protein